MNKNFLIIKNEKKSSFLLFLFILCFCIILPAPIITYGTQLILLALIVILMIINSNKINIKSFIYIFIISFFILTLTYIQSIYLKHQQILWLQSIRVCFWISCCIIAYSELMKYHPTVIKKCIEKLVFIISIFIIFQYISYYIFNIVIDYSTLLGGSKSRILYNNIFRPSGLTAEPSITSGILISLLSIYYIFNKKFNIIYLVGIISCFLSSSTIGIILASVFFIIAFTSKKNLFLILLITPLISIVLIPEIIIRYEKLINGFDSSNNIKIDVITNFINTEEIFYLGYGFIGKSESAPRFYEALYDLTIFGNSFIIFGFPIGIIVFLLLCLFIGTLNFSLKEKSLILLSMMKISSPTFPFFNIFVLLLIIVSKMRKK